MCILISTNIIYTHHTLYLVICNPAYTYTCTLLLQIQFQPSWIWLRLTQSNQMISQDRKGLKWKLFNYSSNIIKLIFECFLELSLDIIICKEIYLCKTWIKSVIQYCVHLTSCIVSGNSEANRVQDKADISSCLWTKKLEINILV